MKRIFLIGDSISLDYGKFLEKLVNPQITLYSKPGIELAYQDLDNAIGGNGGDSRRVAKYVKELKEQGKLDFDYFVFNCGLHDIKRNKPDRALQVGVSEYERNLREIVKIMKESSIKIIFVNTTPADILRYSFEGDFVRYNEDVIYYNSIAEKVMQDNHIKIIDLYGFTSSLNLKGNELFRDHAHYNRGVIELQAAYIAGHLNMLV